MYDYGWIDMRSEKQLAIRLTPAGLKAMQSVKPSAEIRLKAKPK
jgi:hypothetical protein